MFRSLSFYIDKTKKQLEEKPAFLESKVKKQIKTCLGEEISREIKDVFFSIKKRLLLIRVSNPIFAQEIKNKERSLLEIVNKSLPQDKNKINKIIIKF